MPPENGNANASTPKQAATLLGEIIVDAQTLVRQELELAKVEIRQELDFAKAAAVAFCTAVVIGLISLTLFFFGLVYLLNDLTHLPMSACFGIVFVIAIGLGAGYFYAATRKAKPFNFIPRETLRSLKENLPWIRNNKPS